MKQIRTMTDFQDFIEHAGEVRAVIFGATWCPNCHALASAADDEARLAMLKIDEFSGTQDARELCDALEVDALPAVRRFVSGHPAGRLDGVASVAQLKNFIENGEDVSCDTCETCGGAR